MFSFQPVPEKPLAEYLREHLDAPRWGNAMQVVPFLVWLSGLGSPLDSILEIQERGIPHGNADHVIWSLASWSAFRKGDGDFSVQSAKAKETLPEFARQMASRFSRLDHHRLADLTEQEALILSQWCDPYLLEIGKSIKGKESHVLPSKLAHYIYPSLLPAYDLAEVESKVLRLLLHVEGRRLPKSYGAYLRLSNWILRQFKEQGSLNQAGDMLFDHLRKDGGIQMLSLDLNRDRIRPYLDSIIAEYTLVQMANELKSKTGNVRVLFRLDTESRVAHRDL
jgi:hypothetical protein